MNNRLTALQDAISRVLDTVIDPISGKGLHAAGRVKGLSVRDGGRVGFTIEAPPGAGEAYEAVREAAEKAARAAPGVSKVLAVLTAERAPAQRPAAPRPPAPQHAHAAPAPAAEQTGPRNVRAVIAVASAKGGVGKSTVAVNLACALAALGQRVGLLDADVYGPSLPTLVGAIGRKPSASPDKKLHPIERWGLATMSIGYLVDPDTPMVWRGAMATGAVRQLLEDVAWAEEAAPLDVLVIDMPPGTGDVQLTLAQRVSFSGAVIVSTPQEIALADVRRGIAMFEKMHVPLLGVIENMAYFELPDGSRAQIFGEGGARRTAEAFGAPFLGEIPLDPALRESGDEGAPLAAAQPGHPVSQRFLEIARATLANLAAGNKPAPAIRFS
ncbi:MAG: P-loop NTPase [Hyphomonadaceae bacterium]